MIWADRLSVTICIALLIGIGVAEYQDPKVILISSESAKVFAFLGIIPSLAVLIISRLIDWIFTGHIRGWLGQ